MAGCRKCPSRPASAYQFRPHLCREPEIELIFHHAHNPFAEPFAEEEVVVDPWASYTSLPGVPSAPASPATRIPRRQTSRSAGPVAMPGKTCDPLPAVPDADFDPVLPDDADEVLATPLVRDAGGEHALPGDDRDLLEIIDDTPAAPADYALAIAAYRPRRREYRQLFASLRGR